MGAGTQRWWRSFDEECEAWSQAANRALDEQAVALFRRIVHESDGIEARIATWTRPKGYFVTYPGSDEIWWIPEDGAEPMRLTDGEVVEVRTARLGD